MLAAMGYSRGLMVRWWDAHDERALEQLVTRGALYSATRDVKNAAASCGEYLVSRALGATRFGQAHPRGDCLLPSGRAVEVKTTTHAIRGWPLGYLADRMDYAVVRLD